MTRPNFLVIGAAKAGTTSLHHYLRQHPAIYLTPVKETNFFWTEAREHGRETAQALADYERLFDGVTNQTAIGEISPNYLDSATAAERIRRDLPDVRIVVCLRNPADRAWSDYLGLTRILREHGSFEEATAPGRPCRERGFYFPRLQRYFDRFARDRIHVMLYDDFASGPRIALRSLFAFLGVDPDVPIDPSRRHNAAAIPRSRALNRVLWPSVVALQSLVPRRWRGTGMIEALLARTYRPAPRIDPEVRNHLIGIYRDDIVATGRLIGRDLSGWLE
ncbi:MAG TPA: sulfotransferase [Thermoanaerobaculia bacterium]|nr:sulfotransferase [Thermoanaerobaculia bacterium]